MTEHALTDLLARDLTEVDLVALMIDGVHFADHLCVVALGIDIDGTKHPLAVVEGSTESTTLASGLLGGPGERGLDVSKADPGRARRRPGAVRGGQGGIRPPGDRLVPTPQVEECLASAFVSHSWVLIRPHWRGLADLKERARDE
jgi:hypothetical protein